MSNSALHFFVKAARGENASIPIGKSACQLPFLYAQECVKGECACLSGNDENAVESLSQ
jgi:hypothetical protein